jgi:hypothetical protein
MEPQQAQELTPQEMLQARNDQVRHEMCQLEREMRPLRAELEIISSRFIKLWNEKNRIERQLIPVKKLPSKKAAPSPSEIKTVNPDQLLNQIKGMSKEQVLAIMQTLQEGAAS